jgi:site-specific DNA-methyltransferase (adenine-specific)
MGISIRMAGFEIRDSIGWVYGSGFPKSLDVSKAIDKQAGAEREVLGRNPNSREQATKENTLYESGTVGKTAFETKAATPEAKQWQGWGTALKPALEPIVVARKPLIGTVAENVLTHGTGGLNIDASRIGTGEDRASGGLSGGATDANLYQHGTQERVERAIGGRWPANLILDEYTAELLDEQSGTLKSGELKAGRPVAHTNVDFMSGLDKHTYSSQANSGGASRFFYVAKASKRDRNEGLEDLRAQRHSDRELDDGAGGDNPRNRTNNAKQNFHPTVKPTALMQYLVKLITPPGGTVLDPFTGSGSTGKAAILEGFDFIGIELTEDYWPIIEGRLKHAEAKVAEAKENIEAQPQGLF